MEQAQMRHLGIFKGLSNQGLRLLLASAKQQQYDKGWVLFRQGTDADSIWLVVEGWVHLVRATQQPDQQGVVLFTITPAELFCGVSALEPGTYSVSGITGTECVILRIPAKVFRQVLLQEPKFACQMLEFAARRIRNMAEQYGTMVEPVARRVIRALLRLQGQFGNDIPVTHRELAQMSWTTTESAIRTVLGLKRGGWVTGVRGHVMIKDAPGLRRLLHEPVGNGHGGGSTKGNGHQAHNTLEAADGEL